MSDQPNALLAEKRVPRIKTAPEAAKSEIRLDADASAALALAVSSARKKAEESGLNEEREQKGGPARAAAPMTTSRFMRPTLVTAALAVAVLAGFVGARGVAAPAEVEQPWADAAQALRRSQDDVLRLTGDVKALKISVEALKASVDQSRSEMAQKQGQITERLDRSDRNPQEASARIARLAEQLDRIEAAGKAPSPKLDAIGERLDRLERQIATALTSAAASPTAPAAPAAPTQTGSLEAKPAKDQPVEGWVLHEVYGGVALIEGSNRRLFEVGPGGNVPGIGRVEAIERRGKQWVVVTAKGVIGMVR